MEVQINMLHVKSPNLSEEAKEIRALHEDQETAFQQPNPSTIINSPGSPPLSRKRHAFTHLLVTIYHTILNFFLVNKGIFAVILASACISCYTALVKDLHKYDPVTKVVWKLQGALLPFTFISLYYKIILKRSMIKWDHAQEPSFVPERFNRAFKIGRLLSLLLIRGVLDGSKDILQFYSLSYLPLADCTVITCSTPIIVPILAHFFLGEKFGVVSILTAVLTLTGVFITSKPPILTGAKEMSSDTWIGDMLAIFCVICDAVGVILSRRLRKEVHYSLICLAVGLCGTVEALILIYIRETPLEVPDTKSNDWILGVIIVITFFMATVMYTVAMRAEQAGMVTLLRTCGVMLTSFVLQDVFFSDNIDVYSYLGAGIVIIGLCLTMFRRWIQVKSEDDPVRKKFRFVLY